MILVMMTPGWWISPLLSVTSASLSPDEASQEPPSMVTKLSKLGRKKENQAQKTQKT